MLCELTAQNLRNSVGHGLTDGFRKAEAALLVQPFCHVRGMHVDTGTQVVVQIHLKRGGTGTGVVADASEGI